MKCLLDTHVWIWYMSGSARLSKKFISIIDDRASQIYLSPISVWETLILAAKGRIVLSESPEEWIKTVLEKNFFFEAPLTHTIALESRKIKLPHEDPADRFLAATCLVYEMKLLTEDRQLNKWQKSFG